MRPPDPEVAATLEAIDATLAGEPVDPRFAEVAELALLLRAERSIPGSGVAARLDERVERRFEQSRPARRAPTRWLFAPAAGLAVAVVVAIVLVASSGGATHGPRPTTFSAASGSSHALSRAPADQVAAPAVPSGRRSLPPSQRSLAAPSPALSSPNSSSAASPPLQPPSAGRKVVQSSQLSLSAPNNRIDDVAQEVFNVVGAERGFVNNSTVTSNGGPGGYAQIQLTVPSAQLGFTMTQLSELRYANVVSRTDMSNDVTNQFNGATSQLARAQALRTSLLKQLQNAVSQTQVDAIKAQLANANAQISAAGGTLGSLNHQVSDSHIALTVQARSTPAHSKGGFTLGKAAHDSRRVLEVAAGVVLIALAVLVPVALVVALVWWVAAMLRRRRREQALDLA